MHYSVQTRNWTFVKDYVYLSFVKNMGKNLCKNISKNWAVNIAKNFLIMLNYLQQIHIKLV